MGNRVEVLTWGISNFHYVSKYLSILGSSLLSSVIYICDISPRFGFLDRFQIHGSEEVSELDSTVERSPVDR